MFEGAALEGLEKTLVESFVLCRLGTLIISILTTLFLAIVSG
jgi:hypothetical protein